jgi:hypothetical protein
MGNAPQRRRIIFRTGSRQSGLQAGDLEVMTVDWLEKEFYEYCLTHDQPYFGTVMYALQGSPIRHAYMQLLVEQECRPGGDRPFNILEVGSWAGGSAITWAAALKKFNNGRGFVICLDKWQQYFQSSLRQEPGLYKEMDDALSSGRIFELFMHNVRTTQYPAVARRAKV